MSAFTINRNNEITRFLQELKHIYKTSNNTTAIYSAIEDLVIFKIPESEKLKKIEKEYRELKEALTKRQTVDNMLKQFIIEDTKTELEQ